MKNNIEFKNSINSWKEERLGKITSSNIHKLIKKGIKKDDLFSKTGFSYINSIIGEILTGESYSFDISSKSIQWGIDNEEEAFKAIKDRLEWDIEYYGINNPKFFPYNDYSGASPDALTKNHIIEIKCPFNTSNHIENLIGSLKEDKNKWMEENRFEYYCQIQFGMISTDKYKGYFFSYDPRIIDDSKKLILIEIERNEILIEKMIEKLNHAYNYIRNILIHIDNIYIYESYKL